MVLYPLVRKQSGIAPLVDEPLADVADFADTAALGGISLPQEG